MLRFVRGIRRPFAPRLPSGNSTDDGSTYLRAQSETVGVILLTGVIVVAVGLVGMTVLSQSDVTGGDDSPLIDAQISVTPSELVVTHGGGDDVTITDVSVLVRTDGGSTRYGLEPDEIDGDGDELFEPSEEWVHAHGLDAGEAEVLVVHDPSGTVVAREYADVPPPPENAEPDADISSDASNPDPGDPIEFDAGDSVDRDGTIEEYRWDWNDDGSVDDVTTGPVATHAYGSSGVYTATVEVVDDDGATDAASVTVAVGVDPEASFTTSSTYPEPGEAVTVDGRGSDPGAGTVTAYEWDFDGDGAFEDEGETASRSYATAGTYEITLRITNDFDETDAVSRTVTVTEEPEPAFTTDPPDPNTGETVTFDAGGSTDPDGTIERYEWDFDGDGAVDATGGTATHEFSEYGDRPVTLTVTDDLGSVNSTTATVPVNARPEAEFTWRENGDGELILDGTASSDPDGTIASYSWRIEGQWFPRYGETITQGIDDDANSSVTLEVTDDDGATDSVTKEIPYTLQGPGFGAGVAVLVVLVGAAARRRGLV